MFKKIMSHFEEVLTSEAKEQKDAQHIAAQVRQQALTNCELDLIKAKFDHYQVGKPIKIK